MITKRKYKRIADDQYKRLVPEIKYHKKVRNNVNPECVAQIDVQFPINTILDQIELCVNKEGEFYLAAYWKPTDYLVEKVMQGVSISQPKPVSAQFESNTIYVNSEIY